MRMTMLRFILKRLLHGLVVVIGVTIVVFVSSRLVGDPINAMLPVDAPPHQREALRTELGLDKSIGEQFVSYMSGIARGDFGDSLWQARPALDIVLERLPNTLRLTAAGLAFAVLIGIPLGVVAAMKPNTAFDRLASTSALAGLSAPQFWVGLILILVLAVQLNLLPTSGLGGWKHLLMPAVTLALPAGGTLAMMVRSTMIDELNRPWIKAARLRGMPGRRVVGLHALRNASVPVVTLIGWELAKMLAGATVIVEVVFAWPGIGQSALQAVERNDQVLLQTIVLVAATITVLLNIVVDILYKLLDPRVRLS